MASLQAFVLLAFVASCLALSARDILRVRLIGSYIEDGETSDEEPTKQPVYEWIDYGRFLRERSMFAQVNISQHWLRPRPGKTWRTIDIMTPGACNKSLDTGFPVWSGCKAEAVQERHRCVPTAVEGCTVDLRQTPSDDFVDVSKRLENGSWLIVTKHR
ncbi:hypothetical protein AAVH_41790, partial [Aphelenchoides avenae]